MFRTPRSKRLSLLGLAIPQLALLAWIIAVTQPAEAGEPRAVDAAKIYGKIQLVDSFPDYKVQIVNSFPDLRVQVVSSFPDSAGKWQMVNSFPDYKVQIVSSHADFKIQYVESFPGTP
jgi:hypothetical protein